MTKRPAPTSGFAFRGKEAETGCGKALVIIGAVIIIAMLFLFLTRIFGL